MKAIINGATLAYSSFGRGPAVLLIHDFPLSGHMWGEQISALTSSGYRVIVPDLCGYGESYAEEPRQNVVEIARDMVGLLNYLGIGRAAVCGCGLGATIVLEMLGSHKERVAVACLVSAQALAESGAEKVWRDELADLVRRGFAPAVIQTFAPLYFCRKTMREQPSLLRQIQTRMEETSTEGLIAGLQILRSRPDYTTRAVWIKAPVLVINGERNRVVLPERSRELASALPHSQYYCIPSAGHLVNLERPLEFNQILLDFLNRLQSRKMGDEPVRKVA